MLIEQRYISSRDGARSFCGVVGKCSRRGLRANSLFLMHRRAAEIAEKTYPFKDAFASSAALRETKGEGRDFLEIE